MTTHTKRVILILLAVFSSTFISLAPLTTFTAQAAAETPTEQLEKWLYYRGMRACLQSPDFSPNTPADDNGTRSASDINEGHLLPAGSLDGNTTSGGGTKEGFGYLAPDMDGSDGNDGTVGCADGSIFVRGATAFGFGSVLELVCEMNQHLSGGDNNRIEPSHPTKCTDSDKIKFDGGGGSVFQQALTKALENGGTKDRPQFDINNNNGPDYSYKALLYVIGKRSVETFCGNGAPFESAITDLSTAKIEDDNDIVSVRYVKSDGTIDTRHAYPLANSDRTEGSKVNDVYYKQGGNDNEADDLTCAEMSKMTRDYASDYADWVLKHPELFAQETSPGGEGAEGSSEPVCSAGALGWVLCPFMKIMAETTEWVAEQLEDYLAFNPFAGSGNQIKTLWTNILNVANIMLVVAFLVVVFSQSTSIGLSSYGIKRMLPRIIAAAVLMNLSYYICQILIDLSNIAGVGVTSLVSAASGSTFSENVADVGAVRMAVAATAIVAVILFFFLVPVVLAFLAIFFTIAARNAIIVLLVIVAPLAFAAWILPNTEKYFKKWWELFFNMLVLFPLTMLVFSAAVVAANVIQTSATPSDAEGSGELQSIIALIVLALPLFAMPLLFKTAGGALGKLNTLTKQGLSKYGGDQASNFMKDTRQRQMRNAGARMAANRFGLDENGKRKRSFGGAIGGGLSTVGGYKARRDFRLNSQKSDAERLQQDAIANRLQVDGSRLAAKSTLRGETGRAIARARGIQMQDQMIGEEMKAANTVIENLGLSNAEIGKLGSTGTGIGMNGTKLSGDLYQKAAQGQLVSTGQVGHIYDMLDKANKVDPTTGKAYMSDEVRGNLAYHLERNFSMLKAKDHTLNSDTIKESLRTSGGEVTQGQLQEAALANLSGLKKEQFAEQDAKGIGYLAAGINAAQQQISSMPTVTVEQREAKANLERQVKTAIETAATSYNDPLLEGKFTVKSREAVYQLLNSQGIRVAPPQSSSSPQSGGSADNEIIIPRPSNPRPAGSNQQAREQGGNFNNGPGQGPNPPTNP